MRELIDKLERKRRLSKDEYAALAENADKLDAEYLFGRANAARERVYGRDVYMRGLIEFSSFCKNDCLYCGIRRGNRSAERYRLSADQILSCCKSGYALGFRTFVLQGGEDAAYPDDVVTEIVREIRAGYPDCAITLSLGERSRESYAALFAAGANRYLLRHETANAEHYAKLHPPEMSLSARKECLYQLKEIGYQIGCGFMVGSPYQTAECIADDLTFIGELEPHMVGIGPFIPHSGTPFKDEPHDAERKLRLTLVLLAVIRLMLPNALIPATTALGTIDPKGREMGILAGANVVMPNLSPVGVRAKYLLYDGKICTGDEAAECRRCMELRMERIGYKLVINRGDYLCTT
ncbi:[FeFe] hydrogenase H-cluster radical SAM maturase HydE [Clostridia bacterium]|nr:[FeFe] hydrogenase H-cluster radical SAM maturase HydE [Clostridia bacterium]